MATRYQQEVQRILSDPRRNSAGSGGTTNEDENDEEESEDDRPILNPGEIVSAANGDHSYRIDDLIGEGRCCLVYSAHSIRDDSRVAVKVFKKGPTYEGAIQREQYILDSFSESKYNIVLCFARFYHGPLYCQIMELLDCNIRQAVFKNDRQGLPLWSTRKFALDLLTSLEALHAQNFVHADLKPANVMWSPRDGCFKLLDFGLTFHTDERDLHQVQTRGYQAPEAAAWNAYKEEVKRRKSQRRTSNKQQGDNHAPKQTQLQSWENDKELESAAAGQQVAATGGGPDRDRRWPSESSGVFTGSEISPLTQEQMRLRGERWAEAGGKGDDYSSLASSNDTLSSMCRVTTVGADRLRPNSIAATEEEEANGTYAWKKGGGGPGTAMTSVSRRFSHQITGIRPRPPDALPPPLPPTHVPNTAVDIWSFGCLLFEAFTGTKLFRAGDKLASVLRPSQLVEMKIGETEIRYCQRRSQDDPDSEEAEEDQLRSSFHQIKDLILRCLDESPISRITANAALSHPFLKRTEYIPTALEMVILPSNVMLMVDVLKDKNLSEEQIQALLKEIRTEASRYGPVCTLRTSKNRNVYVEFAEASDCEAACSPSTGLNFNKVSPRSFCLKLFYPVALWNDGVLL